jgi:hypothetical protein
MGALLLTRLVVRKQRNQGTSLFFEPMDNISRRSSRKSFNNGTYSLTRRGWIGDSIAEAHVTWQSKAK